MMRSGGCGPHRSVHPTRSRQPVGITSYRDHPIPITIPFRDSLLAEPDQPNSNREGKTMWNVQAVTMAVLLIISASPAFAEGNAIKGNAIKLPLNDASQVVPRNVTVKAARYGGKEAPEVRPPRQVRGPGLATFLFFSGLGFPPS